MNVTSAKPNANSNANANANTNATKKATSPVLVKKSKEEVSKYSSWDVTYCSNKYIHFEKYINSNTHSSIFPTFALKHILENVLLPDHPFIIYDVPSFKF